MSINAFSLLGNVEVRGTRQAEQELKGVDQKAQALHSRFARPLPNPFKQLSAGARQAEADIARVNAKMKASSGAGGMFGSLLGANVAAIGITAVTAALGAGGRAVLDYSGRLEQLKIGFSTLLGSTQAAEAHLKSLEQFAAKTPFEFEQVAKASQRFHNMGLETKKVIPLLTAVGDAVAAAGGSSESIDRVSLALSQMIAKGKVSAEEMNQLAEAGVGGWRILEQQLGITKEEAIKLAEQGKISADTFIDAFQKVSRTNFGGAMEKQAKTFQGAMSTIKHTLLTTAATAFEPFFKKISEITVRISQELQNGNPTLERSMRTLMEGLGDTAAQAGVFLGQQMAKGIVDGISNFSFNPAEIFKRFQPITYGALQSLIGSAVDASSPAVSSQTQSDLLRMQKAFPTSKWRPASMGPVRFKPSFDAGAGTGRGGGGGGGGAQRDILEGLKSALVELNAEYRKYDAALLGSANRSALAAEKERILADVMSALGTNTKLAISGLKDVDAAIEKAIGSLPKKAQPAARALVEQSLAQAKANEETRRAGTYAEQTEALFARFRDEVSDTRLGTDQYAVAIRELETALAKEGITLAANTRLELEHQAALQRTLALTRQRLVHARERARFADKDRPSWIDLGGGSTVGGEPGTTERPRFATLDNQVMREQMAARTAELREQMNALANDVTHMFDRATEAFIKTPGRFVDKWKEAFREIGLGFADMMLQMSNDLMRSQVLKLLERIAGIDATSGSESSKSNSSTNVLGALTDKLLNKLGLGQKKPTTLPPSVATRPRRVNDEAGNQDVVNGQRESTDRLLNGQQNQTAQLNQQIQASAEYIVDGLTPRQEGFWKGLLKTTLSAAAGAAAGAAVGGLFEEGGSSGSSGNETRPRTVGGGGSVTVGVFDGASGNETRPRIVTPRALGGPVSPGQMYLVGEQGPELFKAGSGGSILPNGHSATQGALKGDSRGQTVHYHMPITIKTPDAKGVQKSRAQIERQMWASLRNTVSRAG